MNRDEMLFLSILNCNCYLLSIIYILYCNYYHVRHIDFHMDIILATAFLVSTHTYFQIIYPISNQIQIL